MAWTSGTATNMVGLLQDLESFLSLNGWTVLRSETFQNDDSTIPQLNARQPGELYSTTGDSGVNEHRIVMQGPGYTGGQPPVFGIETRRFVKEGYYYLVSASATGDNAGVPVYYLPGVSSGPRALAITMLWDSPMDYWFTEDGGAVCVVVKVSNQFFHFYIGHYVPLATPGEIPQPAIYTGNVQGTLLYPYNTSYSISCFGTTRGSNQEQVGSIWAGSNTPLDPASYNSATSTKFYYESDRRYFELGVYPNGDYVLYPIALMNRYYGCFGELTLLYKAPFTAVAPGSTVVVGTVTYLITNNASYDDSYNRFAVRLG